MACLERALRGAVYCAEAAWKMDLGTHIIDDCHVCRHPKMVVVTEVLDQFWRIVAFPKLDDLEPFENRVALLPLHGGIKGHHKANPCAIGTVLLETQPGLEGTTEIRFRYARMHFHVGDGDWQLPRRLATYYGGWRVRCLEQSIRLADLRNEHLVIPKWHLPERVPGQEQVEDKAFVLDVRKAAANQGKTIKEEGQLLRIVP